MCFCESRKNKHYVAKPNVPTSPRTSDRPVCLSLAAGGPEKRKGGTECESVHVWRTRREWREPTSSRFHRWCRGAGRLNGRKLPTKCHCFRRRAANTKLNPNWRALKHNHGFLRTCQRTCHRVLPGETKPRLKSDEQLEV